MTTPTCFLVLFAALLPLCARAAPPPPVPVTIVDCAHPAWPTPREVNHNLGADPLDDQHDAWQRMLGDVRRACHHGADSVRIVFVPAPAAASETTVSQSDPLP